METFYSSTCLSTLLVFEFLISFLNVCIFTDYVKYGYGYGYGDGDGDGEGDGDGDGDGFGYGYCYCYCYYREKDWNLTKTTVKN